MQYPAAVDYLYSFLDFEKTPFCYRKFNLKRMARLLDWFGHPERKLVSILVGGTNGKGSTASFLASVLSQNGYATGLSTSPHLSDLRERIQFNGRMISKKDFSEIVTAIRQVVARRQTEMGFLGPITFFELFTLLAVLYFARSRSGFSESRATRGADFSVFEVGMGGRLDATNAVKHDFCVLAPIGLDHVEHLGRTLQAIAREKAAIIQRNGWIISSSQRGDARRAIQARIRAVRAKGCFLGSSFQVFNARSGRRGSRFDFRMGGQTLRHLRIRLLGAHQIENAATALAAAIVVTRGSGRRLMPAKIKKGLRDVFWPGRFEMVQRRGRTFILDGAHNDSAVRELVKTLQTLFPNRGKIVIVGTSREKNLLHILRPLSRMARYLIVTKSAALRAQEPKVILETLHEFNVSKPSFWSPNVAEALQQAGRLAGKRDLIVVTGSLFLVADGREQLKCRKFI